MIVSHPSNLARLVDFYGGHLFDERDPATGNVVNPGVMKRPPDLEEMRRDLYSVSIDNPQHYATMKEVFDRYGIILDPHGAVGWRALEIYRSEGNEGPAVIYETADPGKFPLDVEKALGFTPDLPDGMKKQEALPERIYFDHRKTGLTGKRKKPQPGSDQGSQREACVHLRVKKALTRGQA